MSSSVTSWSVQYTPESPVPSVKMAEAGTLPEEEWAWGMPSTKDKKKKKKAKKVVDDDNNNTRTLFTSAPFEIPESKEKVKWSPSRVPRAWTVVEAEANNTDGTDKGSVENIMKGLNDRIEELEIKLASKPAPGLFRPYPRDPFISNAFNEPPLPPSRAELSKPEEKPPQYRDPWSDFPKGPAASFKVAGPPNNLPYIYLPAEPIQAPPPISPKLPEAVEESVIISDSARSRPGRRLRSLSFSRSRSRSHSPSPSILSDRSSITSRRPPKANNHNDLILSSESGEVFEDDVVVSLAPFRHRRVYVSFHDATSVDLKQYLVLLKYAQPDQWYKLPDSTTLTTIADMADAAHLKGRPLDRQKIHEALSTPNKDLPARNNNNSLDQGTRINAGRALRIADDIEPDCNCRQRVQPSTERRHQIYNSVQYPCADCKDGQKLPRAENTEMMYLSVVQTYQENYNCGIGCPIYKVVRTGSRRAAAAQAFFDAGAHGWSTVFVCALPVRSSIEAEMADYADVVGVRHARSIDEVLVDSSHYNVGWMRVLY